MSVCLGATIESLHALGDGLVRSIIGLECEDSLEDRQKRLLHAKHLLEDVESLIERSRAKGRLDLHDPRTAAAGITTTSPSRNSGAYRSASQTITSSCRAQFSIKPVLAWYRLGRSPPIIVLTNSSR